MGKHVAFTSEFGLDMMSEVGGKGANLGELTSAGFPVPPAFSVKSGAFDAFLEINKLNQPIADIASNIDYREMSDVDTKTARIREIIQNAAIPDDIAAETREAYALLQGKGDPPLVAVRSSVGTRDMSTSSFPGQMDTYHNIKSAEEVLERVKECWASMWTSRAAGTMHAKGIDYRIIIIAPIVQLMIPPESAGVVFTANPLTGNEKELMIDASYGLGESVVGGVITPDNYIICKETKEIKEASPGYKKFRVELDPEKGSGNRRVELSEEEAVRECLTPEQVREIVDLATQIEKHYKVAQDIEWAYSDGKLYVLQARKIAGLNNITESSQSEAPKRPENVWSRKFGDEYLAEYSLPLNYSLLVKWIIEDYLKEIARMQWRKDLAGLEPIRNYNGYAYISGLYIARLLRFIPKRIRESEGLRWFPPIWNERIMSEPFRPWLFIGVLLSSLRDHRGRMSKNIDALRKHCSNIEKSIVSKLNQDYTILSDKEWKRQFDEAYEFGKEHFRVIRWGMGQHNPTLHGILEKILNRWADDDGELYRAIISGLPGTKTAEINRDIWRMGCCARNDPVIVKLLSLEDLSYEEARNKSADSEFWQMLDDLIKRHGHRAATRQISQPRWKETPDVILGFVRAQLNAREEPVDPEIKAAESTRIREKAERESQRKAGRGLFGFIRRPLLRKLSKLTQNYTLYRENQRYHLDYILSHIRYLLLEQSRRLVEKGVLDDGFDVFFLKEEEFWQLIDHPLPSDEIPKIMEERRKHYSYWNNRIPATYLYDDVETEEEDTELSGDVIKGMGASGGRVTGPACVIADLSKLGSVQPGDILVASNIDPGWTNVFPLLGGLVTETGGLLAHGALLAREYGLPAVMGVQNAMKNFKTGEIIELDGYSGTIKRAENKEL